MTKSKNTQNKIKSEPNVTFQITQVTDRHIFIFYTNNKISLIQSLQHMKKKQKKKT